MPPRNVLLLATLLVALPAAAQYRDAEKADAITRASADTILGKPYAGPAVATPRGADGKPLLTGFWKLLHEAGKPDGNLGKDRPGFALPYTARGREALAANFRTIDPEARCIITGNPRLLTSVLPLEILQTPGRLGIFHQLGWHRWVWLDGRKPDTDPDPRYLGNSIGHWEGDTLVIESTGRTAPTARCGWTTTPIRSAAVRAWSSAGRGPTSTTSIWN
ncbi:hypothetical protein H1235_15355 [Pseudoxanthomonas sp. NC8]|nr:hypothetical protein H1235_15355 [Pseudoxanthomonas sp. NC8]